MASAPRWDDHNRPGSARIRTLAKRIGSPADYAAFRESDDGEYLTALFESFENAMNGDWLPDEIAGIKIERAQSFIEKVTDVLRFNSLPDAVAILKDAHRAELAD